MNALTARWIDHATLAFARLMHAESADRPAHGAAAAAWLARPDFLAPDVAAARPRFHSATDFTFDSPVREGPPETHCVWGRLFRAGSDLAARPAVVLLHGWNDEFGYLLRQPVLARRMAAMGLHVVMLELPYHLRRRPPAPPGPRDFISGDLGAMMTATHQALAEHRALFRFLREQGCHRIAVWGYSLGGWLAGLLCCQDAGVDTVVLGTPLSDLRATMEHLPFCRPVIRSLSREPVAALDRLNLSAHRPQVPTDRLRLLVGEHDQFIPRATLDTLWETWGRPDRRIEAHGHMTILGSRRVLRETTEWLWSRLVRSGP